MKHFKIAVIGDCPTQNEEKMGLPFQGYSGLMVKALISMNGSNHLECYFDNIYTFYTQNKKPAPSILESFEARMAQIKPNIILALGELPLNILTGKKGLDKWRGSILETKFGKVIPSYHPRDIMKMYEHKAILNLDIKKVLDESNTPDFDPPKTEFITHPNFTQVMTFLETLPQKFTFDIETWGRRIRCLGLGISRETALCIPFMKDDCSSYWSIDEERQILFKLREIFSSKNFKSVAQNYPFDASMLEFEFGLPVENLYMDTMVAQHCCYAELPKSLDFLCSIYTRHSRYSDYEFHNDISLWTYNCMDCVVTYEVMEKLEKELVDLKVDTFYHERAQPVMILLTKVSHRGLPVDIEERNKMLEECEKQMLDYKKFFPETLNLNSPTQLKEYLYGVLKMKPVLKGKQPSTDAAALEKLYSKYPEHRMTLRALMDYRKASKLVSTYLKQELDNGRLKTSFNATGTKTGRISSSKNMFGQGGNLQNIPRGDFRRIFKAPPGMKIIKSDLSQAEARAVAWYAKIPSLIKNFQNPKFDVHKWNASIIFGKPESEISKGERSLAKPIVHGTNYKMGHNTAAVTAGITPREAKIAMTTYYNAFPELPMWHLNIQREVNTTRMLRTPLGRLRIFFGRMDETTYRSAIAFKPQSLVGDLINLAMVEFEKRMPGKIICQVHDEIVLLVYDEEVDKAARLLKEVTEIPIQIEGVSDPLVIPLEVNVGQDWYNVKEYTI